VPKADLAIVFGGKPKGPNSPGGIPDDEEVEEMGDEEETEDAFDSAFTEFYDAVKSDDMEMAKEAFYRAVESCKE
jgi:hypothetical protein